MRDKDLSNIKRKLGNNIRMKKAMLGVALKVGRNKNTERYMKEINKLEYEMKCLPPGLYCGGASKSSKVYFITDGMGHVKIGHTDRQVKDRLKSLQTGNPHKLSIMDSVVGPLGLEKIIHHHLRDHRMVGEWFKMSTEVIETIKSITGAEIDE